MKINKEEFNNAIKEWIKYLENSSALAKSDSSSITECDAYKKILSMSYGALPLIRELYNRNATDFVSDIQNYLKAGDYHVFAGNDINQLFEAVEKLHRREFVLSSIKGHGLIQLVSEIMGNEFKIVPKRIEGNVTSMEIYTERWLDDNLEYIV